MRLIVEGPAGFPGRHVTSGETAAVGPLLPADIEPVIEGLISCADVREPFLSSLNWRGINAHNIRDQFALYVVSDKNNHAP
jgi:hypothetical protein